MKEQANDHSANTPRQEGKKLTQTLRSFFPSEERARAETDAEWVKTIGRLTGVTKQMRHDIFSERFGIRETDIPGTEPSVPTEKEASLQVYEAQKDRIIREQQEAFDTSGEGYDAAVARLEELGLPDHVAIRVEQALEARGKHAEAGNNLAWMESIEENPYVADKTEVELFTAQKHLRGKKQLFDAE